MASNAEVRSMMAALRSSEAWGVVQRAVMDAVEDYKKQLFTLDDSGRSNTLCYNKYDLCRASIEQLQKFLDLPERIAKDSESREDKTPESQFLDIENQLRDKNVLL